MTKKHKIKNEDPSINFRLSPELRKWILTEAISENKTVSNYLREHLNSFKDGTLYEEQVGWYRERMLVNTTEFLQLVAFVFSKKGNSLCTSTDDQLDWYIKTIKQMEMQGIPSNIMKEFDKVLMDLIRIKNTDRRYIAQSFKFCESSYSNPGFDYDMLENYLLNVLKPYHTVVVDS